MSEKLRTSKVFYSGFLLVLLAALLYLFKDYLMTMSIGILLAISTLSIQKFSLKISKNSQILATIITMIILFAIFCLPFFYLIFSLIKYISNLDINTINETINQIKNYNIIILDKFGFLEPKIVDFLANLDLEGVAKKSIGYLSLTLNNGVNFIVDMGFIMIFIFFTHYYGAYLSSYVASVAPIATKEIKEIFSEVANTMSVVFYSTIANMLLQGVLFALIASFYGYDGVLFGVLFAFASLIPVIGGALIFVPLCIYELSVSRWINAIIIAIYTIVVISTLADNFIKPLIIKFISRKLIGDETRINELLIFFSMMAGLSSFGFWGIVLGPAILTLFIASFRVYVKR
ncbi:MULTISPECIES: AI-2E family transporter [Campylobacter]|uniref:AI-2E family transporter n=1 Tax=Campylobacter TaxID=194 RepID=UPI000A33C3EA|nr:AI-2E family transporter [Campylobacter sp. P0124]MCR8696794.1 AI-2E family transporter [Campylobacter sp. RM19073]